MTDIDSVPSNVQSARQEALLYVFEDNEAVIEMIMKGRNPTMRHVSRTHRVVLDWLFDRISLDPKIQIKDIDTKNQLAHIFHERRFGGGGGVRMRTVEPRSTVWEGGSEKNVTPPKPLNVVQRCAKSDTFACHRASRSSLRSRVAPAVPRWRLRRHPLFFQPCYTVSCEGLILVKG